jgi:hypothetical protein
MATVGGTDPDGLLKSAKKVAVFIELGTSEASQGAYYVPDFARAKKQISEKLTKAKLVRVANPADADIVIVVHELNEGAEGWRIVTICIGDKLDVLKGGKAPSESDTQIFSVHELCGIGWPLNRAMDKLIRAMKRK